MRYLLAITALCTWLGLSQVSAQDSESTNIGPQLREIPIGPQQLSSEVLFVASTPSATDWLPQSSLLKDSLTLEHSTTKEFIMSTVWRPKPNHALLWSILPGGGQIYNRKYWKVPIVWGALMSCFYAINWNQKLYSEYHAAYRDIKSENPAINTAWLAFAPRGTKPEDYPQMSRLTGTLKRGNDYYRRYRDISIVVGVLLYGLSMLDAYVDAELYSFDISPDLSMKISPMVTTNTSNLVSIEGTAPYQVGLACNFSF